MKKRISVEKLLVLFLAPVLVMTLALAGPPVRAAAEEPAEPCANHTQHKVNGAAGDREDPLGGDAACGYVAATEAQPCNHIHSTDCGYVEGAEASLCAVEAAHEHDVTCGYDGQDEQTCTFTHAHDADCGYQEAVEAQPCAHQHDDACGYVEAVTGAPCNHECELCHPTAPTAPAAKTVTAFADLDAEVQTQMVASGAMQADLTLPATLLATVEGAENTEIPGVAWACAAYDDATGMTELEYAWTPVLPEGYTLDLGADDAGNAMAPPGIFALVNDDVGTGAANLLRGPANPGDPFLSIGGTVLFDSAKQDAQDGYASYTATNNRLALSGPVGVIDAQNLGSGFTIYIESDTVVIGAEAATDITAVAVLGGELILDGPGKAEIYGGLDVGGNLTFQNSTVQIQSTGKPGVNASGNCFFKSGDVLIMGVGATGLALDDNVFFEGGSTTILGLAGSTASGVHGLRTKYGNIYVYDGNHTVVGTGVGAIDWGMAVPRGGLSVTGGKLTVLGPAAGGLMVEGGNITVTGGTLEGAGATVGIRASGDIYMQNGVLNAFARAAAPARGWDAPYRDLFNTAQGDTTGKALDAFLSAPMATGGSASGTALNSQGAISILHSTVNASAQLGSGGSGLEAVGIHTNQSITINGSTVAAQADVSGDLSRAVGIHAGVAGVSPGLIQITDSKVMAYGKGAATRYAMFVEDAGQYFGEIEIRNLSIAADDKPPGRPVPTYDKTNMAQYPYVYLGAGNTVAFATNGVAANGVTATGSVSPLGPQIPGTSITVTLTLSGAATAAGTHTVGLSSATLGAGGITQPATVTKTVTAGQAMAAGDTFAFTFTMPPNAVTDLVVTHSFVPSSDKAITAFTLAGVNGSIDESAGTITLTLPYGTDVTALTPAITHTGASVSPTGAQNFTSPVTYTVTAADGSTKPYVVTVTIAQPGSHTITFNANGGRVSPASAATGADGKLASLPTPTRDGHNFNGWFTAATGGTKVTTGTVFTAAATIYAQWTEKAGPAPDPGPTYEYCTLRDEATGVTLTGWFTPGTTLNVTKNALHAQGSCAARDEIRAAGNREALYDVSITGSHNGNVELALPVPSGYNGQHMQVWHCKVDQVEKMTLTAKDGYVTGIFSSLSPFAVFAIRSGGQTAPQTGDNSNLALWIALGALALSGLGGLLWRRRKAIRQK